MRTFSKTCFCTCGSNCCVYHHIVTESSNLVSNVCVTAFASICCVATCCACRSSNNCCVCMSVRLNGLTAECHIGKCDVCAVYVSITSAGVGKYYEICNRTAIGVLVVGNNESYTLSCGNCHYRAAPFHICPNITTCCTYVTYCVVTNLCCCLNVNTYTSVCCAVICDCYCECCMTLCKVSNISSCTRIRVTCTVVLDIVAVCCVVIAGCPEFELKSCVGLGFVGLGFGGNLFTTEFDAGESDVCRESLAFTSCGVNEAKNVLYKTLRTVAGVCDRDCNTFTCGNCYRCATPSCVCPGVAAYRADVTSVCTGAVTCRYPSCTLNIETYTSIRCAVICNCYCECVLACCKCTHTGCCNGLISIAETIVLDVQAVDFVTYTGLCCELKLETCIGLNVVGICCAAYAASSACEGVTESSNLVSNV